MKIMVLVIVVSSMNLSNREDGVQRKDRQSIVVAAVDEETEQQTEGSGTIGIKWTCVELMMTLMIIIIYTSYIQYIHSIIPINLSICSVSISISIPLSCLPIGPSIDPLHPIHPSIQLCRLLYHELTLLTVTDLMM